MKNAVIYYCNDYGFEAEKYLHLLPSERVEKFHRYKKEKDRKNCVGSYLLLLKALEKEGISDFELGYSESGKPYIKNHPVEFSISHCEKGFICAVNNGKIGADIQNIVSPKEATVRKVCGEEEKWATLNDASFTRLWTFKESIIKMKGETIGKYKDYVFPENKNDFYLYGSHFVSFEEDASVITVCGDFDKIKSVKIKSAEL